MTGEKITEWILKGGQHRELAISFLSKKYIGVADMVRRKLGLAQNQAIDVFSDALMAFQENVRLGKFNQGADIGKYLYRIVYNKGIDAFRKQKTERNQNLYDDNITEISGSEENALEKIIKSEQVDLVVRCLERLGKKCQAILRMFFLWEYDHKDIAETFGWESSHVARNEKYRCMKKIRAVWDQEYSH